MLGHDIVITLSMTRVGKRARDRVISFKLRQPSLVSHGEVKERRYPRYLRSAVRCKICSVHEEKVRFMTKRPPTREMVRRRT